jgi:hypothetical protein
LVAKRRTFVGLLPLIELLSSAGLDRTLVAMLLGFPA